MPVPGRSKLDNDYRYGFNGMETDPEAKGTWGNQNTTFFRQYDVRLGRWMSLDPVTHPFQSPYNAMDGNPIFWADASGADGDGPGDKQKPKESKLKVKTGKGTVKSNDGANIETTSGTNYVLNKDCNCVIYSPEAPESSNEDDVSPSEFAEWENLIEEEELEAEEFAQLISQGDESTTSWEDYNNKKKVFIASTPGSDFRSSLGWYYEKSGIKARHDAIVREEQGRRLMHMMNFSFWPAPPTSTMNLRSRSVAAARYRARATLASKGIQGAADDLVVGLKRSHGGNVTVMKNGRPVFRVHQPGTHGKANATITKFRQGINPKSGKTFNIPAKKVSAFDKKTFDILKKASRGQDGYSVVTKGGR